MLETNLSSSSRVYCPEKQTLMSSLEGMLPARSGGEGAVAVQGVVHVHDPALLVGRDRNAAAHVGDDQVRLFVNQSRAVAVQACRGFLVQGVEDRLARAHGHARDAGRVVHLVHHGRIGYVGLHARHVGDLRRQQPSEVAGVLHLGVPQVVPHPRIDLVNPRGDRTDQPAAADDGRELFDVELLLAERREDQAPAPVQLVDDVGKLRDLFGLVAQGHLQQGPFVVVEGDLGGCGAGIYR